MGRFASTVPYYARFREPYPPEFFRAVAQQLRLGGDERLLDAGCGPGLLAIGFAPFVGSCTGLDPEPLMLTAARAAAAAAGVKLDLVKGRIEDMPDSSGSFHLVTIGRALHWMERDATLRVLDRVVAPGGTVVTRGSRIAESNAWAKAYEDLRNSWTTHPKPDRYKIDHTAWFAGSRFRVAGEIRLRYHHQVAVDDLIRRALSKSNTSPQAMGDGQVTFEAAIRKTLEPFAHAGLLDEEIEPIATILQ